MKAQITEILGKKRKDFSLLFSNWEGDPGTPGAINLSGDNVWNELEEYYLNNIDKFASTNTLNVFHRFQDLIYLSKFKNLRTLIVSGSGPTLIFPDMKQLSKLERIHINQQSKPSSFDNIASAPNLLELYIGDFSIPSPVKITSFKDIVKCSTLQGLYLGHVQFPENSIKELASLSTLKKMVLPQTIPMHDLAFLSAKLPQVKSNELKAYQESNSRKGNIKVNGKRMPYLDKDRDREKLEKYELEFERLKSSYLS